MWIACVLIGRADVISSRSIISPAMFDLELEWTVGVGDGGRARRRLPEEAVEKQNTPSVVARHCVYRNEEVNKLN